MREMFEILLSTKSGTFATLHLPAAPCAIQDAMSKLRLDEGEVPVWDLMDRVGFEELSECLNHDGNPLGMNVLTQKLTEMDSRQRTAFAALLSMEPGKGTKPIPLPRLVDLAYSAEACEVIDAMNDSQLGRYYAESGAVPNVKDLPSDVFDLLDFEHIGRSVRKQENGIFIGRTMEHPGGYVVQRQGQKQIYQDLDLTPKEPDYVVLLELSKGYFNDPDYDSEKTVRLKLPAAENTVDAVLTELDVAGWDEVGWTCLDCRVPLLVELITDEEDPGTIITLAQKLDAMPADQLVMYKALMEAADCDSLDSALDLMDELPQYSLSPQLRIPTDAAKAYLNQFLPQKELEYIEPYLNWHELGDALQEDRCITLTEYGLLERKDGQPVLAEPSQEESQRGGMNLA